MENLLIVATTGRRKRGQGKTSWVMWCYDSRKLRITHASGEKCATQLFTEIHAGNASPAQLERNEKEREREINQINRLSLLGGGRDERKGRTFGDFDPLDRFVVHHAGALFDELVALNTEIEDIGALHR